MFLDLYTRCFFMQWRCRCSGSEIGDEVVVPELFGNVVGIHMVVTIFDKDPAVQPTPGKCKWIERALI